MAIFFWPFFEGEPKTLIFGSLFLYQVSDHFSPFSDSFFSSQESKEGQPIPASVRRPFLSPDGGLGDTSSPEPLRVRSPAALQRVAFDIATLKQPFSSRNHDDENKASSDNGSSPPTSPRIDATTSLSSEASLSRPSSRSDLAQGRKAETLVA